MKSNFFNGELRNNFQFHYGTFKSYHFSFVFNILSFFFTNLIGFPEILKKKNNILSFDRYLKAKRVIFFKFRHNAEKLITSSIKLKCLLELFV